MIVKVEVKIAFRRGALAAFDRIVILLDMLTITLTLNPRFLRFAFFLISCKVSLLMVWKYY